MSKERSASRLPLAALAAALAAVVAMAGLGVAFVWTAAVGAAGLIAAAVLGAGGAAASPAPPAPAPKPAAKPAAGEGRPCAIDPEREKMLRMTGELAAAHEIQMLLVPRTFPPLRGCPPFDLYAVLEPAREIGGDFYDYWMLGRDHLAMVIADVSGKGIPSALYMAMARTYLRAFSRHIHDPAELLTRLNREVARHNPSCMFITVFCGIVDLATGVMEYANAGHNHPLRRKRGGKAEWFDDADHPPVGFVPDLAYAKKEAKLEPGEMLFLYTDGVTEAMNKNDEMIGEARVAEIFDAAADMADSCRAVAMNLQSNLSEFTAGRDPYDDITIMTYRHPDDQNWDHLDGSCEEAGAEMGDAVLSSIGTVSSVSVSGSGDGRFFSLTDLK